MDEPRQLELEARLRLVAAVLLAVGVIALALSGVRQPGSLRSVCAPRDLRMLQYGFGALLLPGLLVMHRPTALRIAFWRWWSAPFALLGAYALTQALQRLLIDPQLAPQLTEGVMPSSAWGACTAASLVAAGALFVMPRFSALRFARRDEPPEARVVRR